jgi:hypothetical protein
MARWPAEIPLRSRCFGGSRLRPPYHKPPSSLTQLAVAAGQQACVDLIWRRGSKGLQRGRFLAVRVRPAGVTPRRRARQDGGGCRCAGCWSSGPPVRPPGQVLAVPPDQPAGGTGRFGQVALASGAGLPRAQRCARAGPLRGARLGRLAPPRDPGLGRARLPHPGAAATPKTGGVGLTLWQLLVELQVLLACWAGACPVCRRPATVATATRPTAHTDLNRCQVAGSWSCSPALGGSSQRWTTGPVTVSHVPCPDRNSPAPSLGQG